MNKECLLKIEYHINVNDTLNVHLSNVVSRLLSFRKIGHEHVTSRKTIRERKAREITSVLHINHARSVYDNICYLYHCSGTKVLVLDSDSLGYENEHI